MVFILIFFIFKYLENIFRLNESTLELVERYNDVISTIAETFVRYDEMLKVLEEAKLAKVPIEAS